MTEAVTPTVSSLSDRIRGMVEAGEISLPPIPELALRLTQLLGQEDVDAKRIAALISRDPALSGEILRIANSAAFGGLRQVGDLNQAIARLGFKQVGSVVTALLMKGHFQGGELKTKQDFQHILWDHSVATAFAARRLAPRIDADPDEAFLAGLLHDCGQLLILRGADLLESDGLGVTATRDVLLELIEALHCELGFNTLTKWNLPESICRTALVDRQEVDEDSDPLLVCVQAANLVTQKFGMHLRPDADLDLLQEAAIDLLGVPDIELATLMVEMEDELIEVRKLF